MRQSLLREFVRQVIAEEGDYGGIGDGGYGSYGYGGGMGGAGGYMGGWGGKSILSVMGSPFLDVAKTAYGSGKEVAVQAKGLARTTVEAVLSAMLPFVSGEYEKINKETHEEVQRVKKEYAPLYKSNLDAIFNLDLMTLAFFLNPAAVITGAAFDKFMYSAPDAAMSVLGWFVPLSGRKMWEKTMRAADPTKLQHILRTAAGHDKKTKLIVWDDRNRRRLYANVRQAMGIESGPHDASHDRDNESFNRAGYRIYEEASGEMTYPQVVKGLLGDPLVSAAMTKSEQAQKLKETGKHIMSGKLNGVLDLAKKIAGFRDTSAFGSNEKTDPKTFAAAKKTVIDKLVKSLQAELEELGKYVDVESAGIRNAYEKVMNQMQGLTLNTAGQSDNVSKQNGGTDGEKEQGPGNGSGTPAGRAGGSEASG